MKKLLCLFLLNSLLSACIKPPTDTPDFGPEVALEDVSKAMGDLGSADLSSIKSGEFAYSETSQTIDVQSPQPLLQKTYTVTSRQESADLISLTMVKEINEVVDGGQWKSSKDSCTEIYIKKSDGSAFTNCPKFFTLKKKETPPLSISNLRKADASSPQKVTYHNLRKSHSFWPIPALVARRTDCGGLAFCNRPLRTVEVQFDRVIWENEKKGNRTVHKFVVTPDAPFFSSQLQACAQMWLTIEDRILPVTQCEEIKDFKFGQ